jgi:DNA-binding YbaB/EbfC family protein
MAKGGFGGFGDLNRLMQQAATMKDNMEKAQRELLDARIEATSGGGGVKAVVDGKGHLISLDIKPEVVDPEDVTLLQDMIVAAIQEAESRAEEMETDRMQALTGGVQLPQGLF